MPVAPPTRRIDRPLARRAPRAGYTLAESLIASVVLAAAVVGIAGTLAASYKQSAVRGNVTTGLVLAQQLMEEIASKPMELAAGQTNKPGWASGQTDRRQYDTIDDYNGYADTSGSIQTKSGTNVDLGDGDSYTRSVSVQTSARPTGMTGPVADFLLVTVTVQMPRSQSINVSQLFTRATIVR
jgi:Tfp pilus assembly major pilin PilA